MVVERSTRSASIATFSGATSPYVAPEFRCPPDAESKQPVEIDTRTARSMLCLLCVPYVTLSEVHVQSRILLAAFHVYASVQTNPLPRLETYLMLQLPSLYNRLVQICRGQANLGFAYSRHWQDNMNSTHLDHIADASKRDLGTVFEADSRPK